MEQLTVQNELRARSKSALIRGIVAMALDYAMLIPLNLVRIVIYPNTEWFSPESIITILLGVFVLCFGLEIVSLILGYRAWRMAKSIGLDARFADLRRPPASIVAHVLGLIAFIGGLIILIVLLIGCCVLGYFFYLVF